MVEMANLTISVDGETLKQARIRALEEDTSVNAVLARYLATYARAEKKKRESKKAMNKLLEFAAGHPIDRGKRLWVREELYDR